MAPRWIWTALAVLAVLLICTAGYQHVSAQPPNITTITLSYNGGSCQQNGAASAVSVPAGGSVNYTAGDSTPFSVSFSSCPFGNKCPVTQTTGTVTATSATGTYNYSGVTINGQSCNNPGAMGVRVH